MRQLLYPRPAPATNTKDLDKLAAFYHPDVTIFQGSGVNNGWAHVQPSAPSASVIRWLFICGHRRSERGQWEFFASDAEYSASLDARNTAS